MGSKLFNTILTRFEESICEDPETRDLSTDSLAQEMAIAHAILDFITKTPLADKPIPVLGRAIIRLGDVWPVEDGGREHLEIVEEVGDYTQASIGPFPQNIKKGDGQGDSD